MQENSATQSPSVAKSINLKGLFFNAVIPFILFMVGNLLVISRDFNNDFLLLFEASFIEALPWMILVPVLKKDFSHKILELVRYYLISIMLAIVVSLTVIVLHGDEGISAAIPFVFVIISAISAFILILVSSILIACNKKELVRKRGYINTMLVLGVIMSNSWVSLVLSYFLLSLII